MKALQPATIVKRSAAIFGLSIDRLCSDTREQYVVHARHVTALVLRDTGMTYAAIGRRLKRDRTSVRDGCDQAEKLMLSRPLLQAAYEELLLELV